MGRSDDSVWKNEDSKSVSEDSVGTNKNSKFKSKDLMAWAKKQKSKTRESFSRSLAGTKEYIERQTKRDDTDSPNYQGSNIANKDVPREKNSSQYANPQEYSILALGIVLMEEYTIKAVSKFCPDATIDAESEFMALAEQKLSKLYHSDYCTIIPASNCIWFVKSYDGWIYYLKTTKKYPKFLAVEVLDSLSNIVIFGFRPGHKSEAEMNEYCATIYADFATFEDGTQAALMINQVDDIKDQMNTNINLMLENIESADELRHKSDELLEQSKVFKKKTHELKKEMWNKNKGVMILKAGTVGAVTIGATAGFLAGGPGGAAFVALPSVAAAEMIEVALIASACGVGYYMTAKAALKSWFWSLKFVKV